MNDTTHSPSSNSSNGLTNNLRWTLYLYLISFYFSLKTITFLWRVVYFFWSLLFYKCFFFFSFLIFGNVFLTLFFVFLFCFLILNISLNIFEMPSITTSLFRYIHYGHIVLTYWQILKSNKNERMCILFRTKFQMKNGNNFF